MFSIKLYRAPGDDTGGALSTLLGLLGGGASSAGGSAGLGGLTGLGAGVGAAGLGPWGAALAAVPLVMNFIRSQREKKAGIDLARHNVRPVLNETPEYQDLLQFYEKQAQYGLPAATMAWQAGQTNQGLTRSLNAMLQAGGTPNNVSDLYGEYTDNIAKIAAADAAQRWEKVNAVGGAMRELYGAREKDFLYNKDAPYKDIAQLASAKQQAGFAGETSALDTLSAGLLSMTNKYYRVKNNNTNNLTTAGALSPEAQQVVTNAENTIDMGPNQLDRDIVNPPPLPTYEDILNPNNLRYRNPYREPIYT